MQIDAVDVGLRPDEPQDSPVTQARAILGTKDALIFGLDRNNTEMLRDGKPIVIHGRVGCPPNVVPLAGETLEGVKGDLRSTGILPPA